MCCTLQVRPHTFPAVHEQLLRRYRNAMLQPGKAAAALRLQCLAGGPHWSADELAAALEQVKDVAEVQVRRKCMAVKAATSWQPADGRSALLGWRDLQQCCATQ